MKTNEKVNIGNLDIMYKDNSIILTTSEENEFERFKQSFELLYREIVLSNFEYTIFKHLLKSKLKNEKYKITKGYIIDALKNSFLIKLAKALDNDSTKASITIFYILNRLQSDKTMNNKSDNLITFSENALQYLNNNYQDIMNKIKTTRDKNIVHLDKKYYKGYKQLTPESHLIPHEINEILNYLMGIMQELNKLIFKSTINVEAIKQDLDKELIELSQVL